MSMAFQTAKIATLFAPVLDSFDQPDLGIGCKEPA
jgi:hypothetical protein